MMRVDYVFLRKNGAPLPPGCAGHVGWAFSLTDQSFYCGSTENPSGRPLVLPGQDNGWWGIEAKGQAEMITLFQQRGYDGYKVASVRHAVPEAARHTALASKNWGYTAVGNNCLDHVWRVLSAFGDIGLPWLQAHPSPNDWFAVFNGEYHNLS